jgi:predicted membrane channel-forming protein YqfA (hemolysin III family)
MSNVIIISILMSLFAICILSSVAWADSTDWKSGIVKAALILFVVVASSFLLFGCSTVYPAASQPRALGIGNMQPHCLFFCFQTNTQTDAEAGSTQSATTTNSQSATVSVDAP